MNYNSTISGDTFTTNQEETFITEDYERIELATQLLDVAYDALQSVRKQENQDKLTDSVERVHSELCALYELLNSLK